MALVSLNHRLWYPKQYDTEFVVGGSTVFEMDTNGEVAAFFCQAPFTGNIDAIGFCLGPVNTGDTIGVGIYQVDLSSGPPAGIGAIWDTNTENAAVVIANDDDNKWVWVTLTADAAVVKGDLLCVRFVNGASGDIQFSACGRAPESTWPFVLEGSIGQDGETPLIAFRDDGGVVHIPEGSEVAGLTDAAQDPVVNDYAVAADTTPDHWGVRFQVPFACAVGGFSVGQNQADNDGAFYLVEADWDGDPGNALRTATFDEDQRHASTGTRLVLLWDSGEAAIELEADTWYRLVWVPSGTATTGDQIYRNLPDLATFTANGGVTWHATEAKDPTEDADWTDYDNVTDGFRQPDFALLIEQIDDGTGSGSSGGGQGGGHQSMGNGNMVAS